MTPCDPIALFAAGSVSAPVALSRLLLSGRTVAELRHALRGRLEAAEILTLLESKADLLVQLHGALAEVDHAAAADVAGIAALFDAAVASAPEASVAAYSLGDPVLLSEATTEILHWLTRERLFAAGMDVFDLGCGFGRVAAALAPQANRVIASDVSPRMIVEAHRRYAGVPRLCFKVAEGTGFPELSSSGFDLVLAVDSFPYLFQAQVAEAHFRDAGRALRPGGALVILNLSYAADRQPDLMSANRWAAAAGLHPEISGVAPFVLWDGLAFVYRRH